MGLEVFRQLLADQLLLHALQHRLGFLQSKTYILDSLTGAINGLDRDAEW